MSRRLALLVPLAAIALPLLARPPPQEAASDSAGGEEIEDVSGPATTAAGARPLKPLKAAATISGSLHPRQSPFLAARPDGRALLGCLQSTLGEGDYVELREVAEISGAGEEAAKRRVSDAPDEIVRPVGVVDGSGRLIVLWTALVQGRPQLRAARESGDRFAPPVTLTAGPAPNLNPEAVLHSDGRVWVAWEGDVAEGEGGRANRDVLVAALDEELALGAPVRVGAGRASDLDACIASAGPLLWVAWTGYGTRDYDVFVRSLDPASGELTAPINVSADGGADDLHPALVAAPTGDAWVAWDRVAIPDRGTSVPADARFRAPAEPPHVTVCCACVRGGRVLLPASTTPGVADGAIAGAPSLSTGGGQPRLALDRDGRLWVAYRYLFRVPRTKSRYGFPLLVQQLGPSGWSDPFEVEESAGMPEAAAILADGAGVLLAWQADGRTVMTRRERIELPRKLVDPLRRRGVEFSRWNGVAALGVARASAADGAPRGDPPLVERPLRLDPPHFHPAGDRLDDPYVRGERHYEVARGGERWSVFWGDLHRHSSISRCSIGLEPTPEDRWASGRDVHLCDFMALTDHTGAIDPLMWWHLDKLGWLYQTSTFCTLLGWEWSTPDWGHHNVILRGRMAPMVSENVAVDVLFRSLPLGDCVTIPHHPSEAAFPNDFAVVDDRFTRLIEVYQACRGNYEFDGCFKQAPRAGALGRFAQDALMQGHKFGIIASTDHGFGQAYACVLATKLDRASVFEALHARRTYGATTKGMFVDFRVGDAVMGEELAPERAPPAVPSLRIALTALGGAELADVVVFKDGRVFAAAGRSRAAANTLAPQRLVARLTLPSGASTQSWSLAVRAELGRFATHARRRESGEPAVEPAWSAHGGAAVLEIPAGFAAQAPSIDLPIHYFAADSGSFTVTAPDGEQATGAGELVERPLAGRGPDGFGWSLALDPSDAVVDLGAGLGTREFRGEWEDPDAAPGPSWYYARIVQVDGEIAWSSPIFVTRK